MKPVHLYGRRWARGNRWSVSLAATCFGSTNDSRRDRSCSNIMAGEKATVSRSGRFVVSYAEERRTSVSNY